MNPAAPAAPGVSDAQAMSGMINALGPATAPSQSLIPGGMVPPAAPAAPEPPRALNFGDTPQFDMMPSPNQQQQPQYQAPAYPPQIAGYPQAGTPGGAPQAPVISPNYPPQFMPQVPQPATFQQPAYQQGPAPQQPQYGEMISVMPMMQPQSYAPALPAAPAPAAIPAAPAQGTDEPPAWANNLIERVDQLAAATGPDWQSQIPANGNWNDVQKLVQSEIQKGIQAGLAKAQPQQPAQAQQPQYQDPAVVAQQQQQQADQYLEQQIQQLTAYGQLPPVYNPADPNDAGRAARRELYAYAIKLNSDNLIEAASALQRFHAQGYYYDHTTPDPRTGTTGAFVRRNSQSAAAQAPIAGASPAFNGQQGQQGPTTRDFVMKDLYTLAEEANRAIPL